MIRALWVALLLALPAAAQEATDDGQADDQGFTLTPELDLDVGQASDSEEETQRGKAANAEGAILRGLDRVSGETRDLELATGDTAAFGRLQVTLGECRYPEDNPAGDAFAYLVIRYAAEPEPVFEGWMIASSPALNALDHPRYDVWVLRCRTSRAEGSSVTE